MPDHISYTPIGWVNGSAPAINANNLNHVDDGIAACVNKINDTVDDLDSKFLTVEGQVLSLDSRAKVEDIFVVNYPITPTNESVANLIDDKNLLNYDLIVFYLTFYNNRTLNCIVPRSYLMNARLDESAIYLSNSECSCGFAHKHMQSSGGDAAANNLIIYRFSKSNDNGNYYSLRAIGIKL